MRQFYVAPAAAGAHAVGARVVLDREESHHLLGVLRGAAGSTCMLVDGRGLRYTARLTGRGGKQAELEIVAAEQDAAEARPPLLVLACAVVKGRRFEWALEKAVELGAHRVVPLQCGRGVIEPGVGRQERWRGVLLAALKQSGRCLLPELDEPVALPEALAALGGARLFYGALPQDTGNPRRTALALAAEPPAAAPAALVFCVGPEGGWTPAETAQLEAAQAVPLDLGPHVLRTETAALAGLAQLQLLRGAWQAGR